LIAGTDSGGLVLRVSPEGKTFALFDTQLREIHALAPAADGSIYALALSDAASTSRGPTAPVITSQPSEGGTPSTSVTITAIDESGIPVQGQPTPVRSRSDVSSARSAVFRILPDGATDVVWSSPTVTAFAIAPALQPGSVLIGTADKGRIYSVTNDGRDTLLLQSPEGQISSLHVKNNQVYAASSNQGKLYRFGTELVSEGTYESPVRLRRGAESGGVAAAGLKYKHEPVTENDPMRRGATGARRIATRTVTRSRARARGLFNGVQRSVVAQEVQHRRGSRT
jgi:hypothetical protein